MLQKQLPVYIHDDVSNNIARMQTFISQVKQVLIIIGWWPNEHLAI